MTLKVAVVVESRVFLHLSGHLHVFLISLYLLLIQNDVFVPNRFHHVLNLPCYGHLIGVLLLRHMLLPDLILNVVVNVFLSKFDVGKHIKRVLNDVFLNIGNLMAAKHLIHGVIILDVHLVRVARPSGIIGILEPAQQTLFFSMIRSLG